MGRRPWSTRQLADLTGSTVKTIRHYHEIGLLEMPGRGQRPRGVQGLTSDPAGADQRRRCRDRPARRATGAGDPQVAGRAPMVEHQRVPDRRSGEGRRTARPRARSTRGRAPASGR
ncbi:MerR family DNA-binding transcriptional regulator [Nonomuraea diastatica]|uniref:MerR family DNA-binding transcriptional regulator n=1 Tax=Nonomuraea diastatica TaxID=1848329 RepID=UPI00319E41F7